MSRALAVLRPEPGNTRTAAAAEALGLNVIRIPLFEVRAVAWPPPDASRFDALVLTSANAVRLGGPGLTALRALPVYAVGAATAEAARAAHFTLMDVGTTDGEELAARATERGVRRALHIGGRERRLQARGPIIEAITVYASEPLAIAAHELARIEGGVALLHSPNAARRLDTLAVGLDRQTVRIAALSQATAAAAGTGWASVDAAAAPDDDALLALARRLAD